MSGNDLKVFVDNGELIDITRQEIEILQGIRDDLNIESEIRREQLQTSNSISLGILVFTGACLGALIFRHLRK